jgi:hypothetical protein
MFQLSDYDILYCSYLHEAFTSIPDSSTSITLPMIKSRKDKSDSPIHISADEKISKHFGKSSIQDERVCALKLELVEITLLAKREDSPKKVRKTFFFY